ncbi:MAG: response regulator [Deltaproteobacteria bacterium]|nr:response regulator [Deltaproteobacteria bacterium]
MAIERCVDILLIDDDDGHALLVEESLQDAGLRNRFERARDGDEGWRWLSEAAGGTRRCPGLVLLDVSMPGLDGFEVLERIKSSAPLKHVPVIMLTSTDSPREIERCYKLGANAYVVKPVDFESLHQKVRTLGMFIQIIEVTDRAS